MASTNRPLLSRLTLYNGMTIPQIQLGLFMMSGREATQAVHWALQAGYRGFDTAQMYGNEREAGRAIASFLSSRQENRENLRREDIHYTTKLMENGTSYDSVRRSIKDSVEACGLGYVDLFLLHSPYGGKEARLTSWRALEDAVESGEVRMIGVSNFGVRHVEELMASNPRIKPVVNQFEVHPFHTQMPIRKVCKKYDITVEAYAPFARGLRLKHPAVVELANKYSCTTSQLLVKWAMQHNMVTLPKSTRRERMISNVDVGGLQISEQDMRAMDNLDEGFISAWNPTNAA